MINLLKKIFGSGCSSREHRLRERMGKPGTCHLPDGIDWHSHILPGVDDGFSSLGQSLQMLELYERAGMSEVWLTPHIMEDVPNETSRLRARFAELEGAYSDDFARRSAEQEKNLHDDFARRSPRAKQKLRLHLAAENMLDALFEKRLMAGDLLPLGEDGKLLLVETSIFSAPMNFLGLLERIKNKGYTPVLAHPERYLYMEKSDYVRLKAMGVMFQRNLFSVKGQYGEKVKKRCKWLLHQRMYDLVGSDLHREGVFWQYW